MDDAEILAQYGIKAPMPAPADNDAAILAQYGIAPSAAPAPTHAAPGKSPFQFVDGPAPVPAGEPSAIEKVLGKIKGFADSANDKLIPALTHGVLSGKAARETLEPVLNYVPNVVDGLAGLAESNVRTGHVPAARLGMQALKGQLDGLDALRQSGIDPGTADKVGHFLLKTVADPTSHVGIAPLEEAAMAGAKKWNSMPFKKVDASYNDLKRYIDKPNATPYSDIAFEKGYTGNAAQVERQMLGLDKQTGKEVGNLYNKAGGVDIDLAPELSGDHESGEILKELLAEPATREHAVTLLKKVAPDFADIFDELHAEMRNDLSRPAAQGMTESLINDFVSGPRTPEELRRLKRTYQDYAAGSSKLETNQNQRGVRPNDRKEEAQSIGHRISEIIVDKMNEAHAGLGDELAGKNKLINTLKDGEDTMRQVVKSDNSKPWLSTIDKGLLGLLATEVAGHTGEHSAALTGGLLGGKKLGEALTGFRGATYGSQALKKAARPLDYDVWSNLMRRGAMEQKEQK